MGHVWEKINRQKFLTFAVPVIDEKKTVPVLKYWIFPSGIYLAKMEVRQDAEIISTLINVHTYSWSIK